MKIRETLEIDVLKARYLARFMMYVGGRMSGSAPIPWPLVRLARRVSAHRNALLADGDVPVLDIAKLRNRHWRTVLAACGRPFDQWSLNHEALNVLERYLVAHRPKCILEFGGGLSTLCIAAFMHETWGAAGVVCCIEQDARHADWVCTTLERQGLAQHVRIKVAPLARHTIYGVETSSYDISEAEIGKLLGGCQPTMAIIDGPFGDGPVRLPTLPSAFPFLPPGSVILLDDALRDNELMIMESWARNLRVRPTGVRPIRKGLAELVVN